MTNRRTRQFDRAVREYQRTHPGTTLPEAREAVAAHAAARQQGGLPTTRIPNAPLPRPRETLADYTKRVAAAAGVHRHRAMELLGLAPGSSASRRLADLTRGRLRDDAVRALVAATGMTPHRPGPSRLPARYPPPTRPRAWNAWRGRCSTRS